MERTRTLIRSVRRFLVALTILLSPSVTLSAGYSIDTAASPSPITGLWWNQNESGWGMTLTQQYDVIFIAMYTYDFAGNPIWYAVTNCPVVAYGCTGDMYKINGGSPPTSIWNPNLVFTKVGTGTLVFTDNNTATFNFSINGTPGAKAITRQVFRGPVPGALTPSYPLQTGYKALLANGLSKNFTVSGDCSGSGTKTSAPARTSTSFEGVAALSATSTFTMSLTNCTPASTAQTSISYYDLNFVPLGFNSVGVNYGVYLTAPTIPVSVSVGGTATIGTVNLYTNSTKSQSNGTQVISYVVLSDTSNTAIINLIAKLYNAVGTLTATEQGRYRIDASGTLVPISTDIQYANGSTLHLVFTYF